MVNETPHFDALQSIQTLDSNMPDHEDFEVEAAAVTEPAAQKWARLAMTTMVVTLTLERTVFYYSSVNTLHPYSYDFANQDGCDPTREQNITDDNYDNILLLGCIGNAGKWSLLIIGFISWIPLLIF